MELIKYSYFVPAHLFAKCLICGTPKEEICRIVSRKSMRVKKKNIYYLDKFEFFLKEEHNIAIEDYCEIYLKIKWPIAIGSDSKKSGHKNSGSGINISKYQKHRTNKNNNEKFKIACEKMSEVRRGENNPMYGKIPWNMGLNKSNNKSVNAISQKLKNRQVKDSTKLKQREARKNSSLKARHTSPHTEETKAKLRKNTLKIISLGLYNRETEIEKKVFNILGNHQIEFKKQYIIDFWCVDIAFPLQKVVIELDGDYFHSNPKKYPNGPITKTQIKNYKRDIIKNKYLTNRGWKVIRLWESEIHGSMFEEKLLKILKENDISKNN